MKKTIIIFLSLIIVLNLAACSDTNDSVNMHSTEDSQLTESTTLEFSETEQQTEEENTLNTDTTSETEDEKKSNILIAYFTYGENAELPKNVDASTTASIQYHDGEITGNTGLMARMIAEASGGELFSIQTMESYPDNYEDTIDVGETEKQDDVRPEISTHIGNMKQYDTIFVGFPNWWGDMPMVMYSFFDEYDFSGKTIIPFCTSGGSAFSDSIGEIRNMEPDATVHEGLHISDSSVSDEERTVQEWLDELGLLKK